MARMTAQTFAEELHAALGAQLITLLLYGSAARGTETPSSVNTLLIVAGNGSDAELFARIARPVRRWTGSGHPPPLILTEQEWRESADAFPIEYQDIRAAHRVLAGRDPWDDITVERDDVRRQLEHELKGKLVHLRQAYAAYWNDSRQLNTVVRETRAGFLTMLRAVMRLAGRTPPESAETLVRDAGALIGFGADGLTEPAAYLTAVTRTAEFVNRMERNAP
jgi:hypothetical protein